MERRIEETPQAFSERRKIVGRLERYGLRVLCVACLKPERHRPSDGRLEDLRCGWCGGKMKTVRWVAKHRAFD